MTTFRESNIRNDIKKTITDGLGFSEQTLIQEKTIPLILKGKDLLGESATGSGKTLAFAVGVIEKVIPKKGLQALIITPTRELAEQVKKYIVKMAGKKINIASVYGGVSIKDQIVKLKKTEVVIATPGRLKDHMQRKTIDMSNISILVLDEADRMLDMGFIEDIEEIIRACPKKRQTLFFSATLPKEINKLADKYTKNAVKISATKQVDPSKLKQVYYDIERNMKFSLLLHLLNKKTADLVMIFCNTRRTTDMVVKNLRKNDINAVSIHGGYTQNKRTQAIDNFKKGKRQVLVCTDVAARGIHVENISHIYNYEIPSDPTDYVHRIGRTARAGEKGKVINLLSKEEHGSFRKIIENYRSFDIKKIDRPYIKKVNIDIGRKKFYNKRRRRR